MLPLKHRNVFHSTFQMGDFVKHIVWMT